jgi:hypothetical protein
MTSGGATREGHKIRPGVRRSGIEPIGAIDRAPSLVEKRTWQPAAETDNPLPPQVQQTGDTSDELPRLDRLGEVHLVARQK